MLVDILATVASILLIITETITHFDYQSGIRHTSGIPSTRTCVNECGAIIKRKQFNN